MSLQLALPPEIQERLRREAARRGVSEEALALQLLDEHLPHPRPDEASPEERAAKLRALFAAWEVLDREAGEALDDEEFYRGLDAARTSDRKLFPDEMKGISW